MSVSIAKAPRTGRVTRSPRHTFQLRHRPFLLQPFMIAPVVPGETMKSALLQSRAVVSNVANPLVGWWLEYYFFYVKHRDLEGRDDFSEMMLDLDKDLSAYDQASAASWPMYTAVGGRKWLQLCYDRIVDEYFRNEGEVVAAIDGLAPVKINVDGIFNSAVLDDDFVAVDDVTLDTSDSAVTASEIDAALRTWQFQRANGLTAMDYEDFLATYGVSTPAAENHRPELLRYVREWQYPTNTVDPATGVPASAVSWAVSERADKDRFFREPGFIVGVTVARAKVYLRGQAGAAASYLRSAVDWLPALLADDPWTSVRKFSETDGPFAGPVADAGGYWLDLKDLFIHGDQFVNFNPATVVNGSFVDLPLASLAGVYLDSDDINGLFLASATNKYVQQDGVCQLSILGRQVDTTPDIRRLT